MFGAAPVAPGHEISSHVASEAGDLWLGEGAIVELSNNDLVLRGATMAEGVSESEMAFAAALSGRVAGGAGLRSSAADDDNAARRGDRGADGAAERRPERRVQLADGDEDEFRRAGRRAGRHAGAAGIPGRREPGRRDLVAGLLHP
jgi:hypothetical protein